MKKYLCFHSFFTEMGIDMSFSKCNINLFQFENMWSDSEFEIWIRNVPYEKSSRGGSSWTSKFAMYASIIFTLLFDLSTSVKTHTRTNRHISKERKKRWISLTTSSTNNSLSKYTLVPKLKPQLNKLPLFSAC